MRDEKKDRYLDCYCKSILDEDKKISLIVQRISDTTTKKKYEEALRAVKRYAEEANILKSGKHDVDFYSNMWNSILNDGR